LFREAAIDLDGKAVFGVIRGTTKDTGVEGTSGKEVVEKSYVKYYKGGLQRKIQKLFSKEGELKKLISDDGKIEYNERFVEICKSVIGKIKKDI